MRVILIIKVFLKHCFEIGLNPHSIKTTMLRNYSLIHGFELVAIHTLQK